MDKGEIVYVKLPSLKKYGMKYRYYIGRDNRKEHDIKKASDFSEAFLLEPLIGFEPTTLSLRMRCSTS